MKAGQRVKRARRYLLKRAEVNCRPLICGDLDGIRQVVVIPVLAEENSLLETLDSLGRNPLAERERTLVICVVNNRRPHLVEPEKVVENRRTLDQLQALTEGDRPPAERRMPAAGLRLAAVDASGPGLELGDRMGVGEGRRIGLDHGLQVLLENGLTRAPLMCLDADTGVSENYLGAVRRHLQTDDAWAAVVAYEHPMPENVEHCAAILEYELFLRYHELGLRSASSPYAFPTIGSTIVLNSDAYVAAGGMNRRQAGEDFYFLQQLAKTGGISRVTEAKVFPSARVSDRVPFGTGASVARALRTGGGAEVYDPRSYLVLGDWLASVEQGLASDGDGLMRRGEAIHPLLGEFLEAQNFLEVWSRLRTNSPDSADLRAQFHRWFDGFKTLKMIHFLRDRGFDSRPIFAAVGEILEVLGLSCEATMEDDLEENPGRQLALLEFVRSVT